MRFADLFAIASAVVQAAVAATSDRWRTCSYGKMKRQKLMALWPTTQRAVTLFVLLLAATEIFACQLISPDSCIFATHTTSDSSEGGSGDGCLCCCAHIVVVATITPLAPLGFIARAVPVDEIQVPEFRSVDIEHPPRF